MFPPWPPPTHRWGFSISTGTTAQARKHIPRTNQSAGQLLVRGRSRGQICSSSSSSKEQGAASIAVWGGFVWLGRTPKHHGHEPEGGDGRWWRSDLLWSEIGADGLWWLVVPLPTRKHQFVVTGKKDKVSLPPHLPPPPPHSPPPLPRHQVAAGMFG